jgi:hypothetical protein
MGLLDLLMIVFFQHWDLRIYSLICNNIAEVFRCSCILLSVFICKNYFNFGLQ